MAARSRLLDAPEALVTARTDPLQRTYQRHLPGWVTMQPMLYTRLPSDFIDRLRDLLCTVRTGQMFMRSSSQKDRLARIVRLAVGQTGAEVGCLLLVHEDRGDLQVAAAAGDAFESLAGQFVARTGVTGFAIDEGNPVAIADRPGDSRGQLVSGRDDIADLTGLHTRSLLAVPLLVHGRVCGALELRNDTDPRGFDPGDVELATELAFLASAAVEEYRGERFLFALFSSALPLALAPERGREGDALAEELQRWLGELQQSPAWRKQVEMAAKVRALCTLDNRAIAMAHGIIDAILDRERDRRSPYDLP